MDTSSVAPLVMVILNYQVEEHPVAQRYLAVKAAWKPSVYDSFPKAGTKGAVKKT